MKYGESTFDILYLLFVITAGCIILRRAKDRTERYMGIATILLGCGDAFHLVPRVLNYFTDADLTAPLGIGKLITSITMTVFYVLKGHLRPIDRDGLTCSFQRGIPCERNCTLTTYSWHGILY